MVLRAYVLLRVTARFFEMGNGKNVQKIEFFLNILENLVIFFFKLVYNESLYYLLYSFTNPILEKNLIPEIWPKMLLAN